VEESVMSWCWDLFKNDGEEVRSHGLERERKFQICLSLYGVLGISKSLVNNSVHEYVYTWLEGGVFEWFDDDDDDDVV
jgi:hypothetical protein